MSKKSFISVIVVLLVAIAVAAWYVFRTDEPKIITPGGDGTSSDLFPFGPGKTGEASKPGIDEDPTTPTIDISGVVPAYPVLRQISFVPTAGAIASSTASSTVIRYIERASGHIYETERDSFSTTKISSVTIPKVHEALWTPDARRLLVRYLREGEVSIRTFYAKIATTTRPEQALEGLFLPDGIRDVTIQGSKIFYLAWKDTAQQGITANIDGSDKTIIFSSSFGEWAAAWGSPSYITLYSKPSGGTEGAAYLLNASKGDYIKEIGGTLGLEALSNFDGSLLLYSGSDGQTPITGIVDTKKDQATELGISTLVAKCVWSKKQKSMIYCAVPGTAPAGYYPDQWYKGTISFNDSLWKIDAATGETTEVFNPLLIAGKTMDIYKLGLDHSENTLIFTDKKDMTVWSYALDRD